MSTEAKHEARTITVEVSGYEQPFAFAITREDYARLRGEERKSAGMGAHNLLTRTCTSHPDGALARLLEEDWTLEDLLIGMVADALGLLREARVKKS